MDLKTLKAIDPSEYADAADGYRRMSDAAGAARDRVDKHITKTMRQANEGEAATAALKKLNELSQNFHYTEAECGLISGALTGFSSEITAPRRRLLEALDDADSLGYTVGSDGRVTYPAGGQNGLTGETIAGGTVTGFNGIYSRGPGPDMTGLRSPNPNRAKAQGIADRIAHAVQEATEIDDRYSKALGKLKAAPGLTVDTKTWADVASDVDAVSSAATQYLLDHIPMDKSPADITKWWDSLSDEERDEYKRAFPEVIGNLDGIPAVVRDEANRENIQTLIAKLEGQHDDDSQTKLDGLKGIQEKLLAGSDPPMYLLGIGDEGNGRAIVAYGNPDTAKNVSAYVPGLGTRLDGDFAGGTMKRAQDTALTAREISSHSSTSSIVWLGYDAPQLSAGDFLSSRSVMFRDDAEAGAPAYNQFMAGISATHENGDPHITAIGHSYGSLTVGLAAQEKGGIPGADDIILVGSPGTGANSADQLNVGKGHVFVGAAEHDIVTGLPSKGQAAGGVVGGVLGAFAGAPEVGAAAGASASDPNGDDLWFGKDPASKAFGATRFEVSDGPTIFEDHGQMKAHSNYFNPAKDQMSADNIARIVVGKSDEIVREQPR
ncbi:alpha/beta hydrolase [Streptomyces sp. NPDC088560]|uniref:alpha/beta hydrolase n=1 Tax=Streptomyces sp. NPDC088560 TaxID=3365868 RepID=UPI0038030BA7